jgi:hypothetical protein
MILLGVTRIIYKNYDEDDEKLSNARATIIKRKWRINVCDILCFGESELNKNYIDVWFKNGFDMTIQHDTEELDKLYEEAQLQEMGIELLPGDPEEEEDEPEEDEDITPSPTA